MFKNLQSRFSKKRPNTTRISLIYRLFSFLSIICLVFICIVPSTAQVSEEWAKRYANTLSYEDAQASDMVVDALGNVYVTGSSVSNNNGFSKDLDFITVKYNTSGTPQWIKRYNGSDSQGDQAKFIAVDAQGNVYVTGTSGTFNPPYDPPLFVTIKYNAVGDQQWTALYDTGIDGSPTAMTVDGSGNVFITGYESSKYTGEGFVTLKYSPNGSLLWQRSYSSSYIPATSIPSAIAVDGNGNVYVTGYGRGDYMDYEEHNFEPSDDFITIKYNAAGAQQWFRRYNSPVNGSDYAKDIAVDANGNVFVTGYSNGLSTTSDYVTIKYSSNGTQQWLKQYNHTTNGEDYASAIVVDGSGNVYITGTSYGGGTATDYATIKYTSSGTQQWMQRYNHTANGEDTPTDLILDAQGNVYVSGTSYGGGTATDFATVKYTTNGTQQWIKRYNYPARNGAEQSAGVGVDAQGNVYVAGSSADTFSKYATVKYTTSGAEQWVKRLDIKIMLKDGDDKAIAMAVDAQGNIYVTGISYSTRSRKDITTVKYSPNGTQLWLKHYNGPGSGNDYPAAITVDSRGNVYITGNSYNCSALNEPCIFYEPSLYNSNYITIKYTPDGTQQWARQYNGAQDMDDMATAIAVDGSGNVYVTGTSYDLFNNHLTNDLHTIKYNPDGFPQWERKFHNSQSTESNEFATAIALDAQGNVYVTGSSNGGGSTTDYATVKYNNSGSQQWAKLYNGSGNSNDLPVSIKTDGSGNVYVAGSSAGSGTGQDYALVKYTSTGTQSWVKRYHNGSYDVAKGLAIDGCGGVYLTGVSRNSTNGLVFRTLKYNTAGTIQWIKSYGDNANPGVHENVAITVDAGCNVYIAGSDNLTTKARYVITKYSSTGTQLWQHYHQSSANSHDQAIAMTVDGSGNVYVTGTSKADVAGSYTDYLTIKLNQNQSSLPAPWKNGDIGIVALTGSASYANGVFTIKSGGFDFYKAPDSYHYVYQPFSGNATIVAKVESMGNTNTNALAGLMIREDLTASSSFVAAAVNPSNTNFMYRQGAGTPGYKSVPGTAPRWLKLARSGNSFTSFYSSDGVSWTQIGTITITMGSNIYVGMALTSQNNTLLNTATFSNVSVSTTPTAPTCTASGSILREYWMNIPGKELTAVPVNTKPNSSSQISSFEAPSNIGDNYGQRIRGYLCAPSSGNYTFYIASDDNSELWLSTTDSPSGKRKIASVTGWARNGDWVKYPSQKSASIALEKGKRYYIEALHKEGTGGDNLAVAWAIPGSSSIAIIPGSVLSPFVLSAARLASEEILQPSIAVYPNPFDSRVTIATNGWQGSVLISLTDVVGKICFMQEYVLSGQMEIELDLSGVALSQGLHLLKVQTQDGKTQVIKVIKN